MPIKLTLIMWVKLNQSQSFFSFQYQLWVTSFNLLSRIYRFFFLKEHQSCCWLNIILLSTKIQWKTKNRFLLTAIKSMLYVDNDVCKSRIIKLEYACCVIFVLSLRKNPCKPSFQIKVFFYIYYYAYLAFLRDRP